MAEVTEKKKTQPSPGEHFVKRMLTNRSRNDAIVIRDTQNVVNEGLMNATADDR